jgi:hypothetical protein
MANSGQHRSWTFRTSLPAAKAALAIVILLALTMVATLSARAQTFNIIHNFTGGGDGASSRAGLTIDAAGNFYGTTAEGGAGYGIVFKLKHSGPSWVLNPLHSFSGGNDGRSPLGQSGHWQRRNSVWHHGWRRHLRQRHSFPLNAIADSSQISAGPLE